MNKIILLIAFVAGLTVLSNAQDPAIYNHYNIAPLLVNPAAVGFADADGDINQLRVNARNQWTGFPGAPVTVAGSADFRLGRFGLGGAVLSENIASIHRLRVQINYGFRFIEQETFSVGFGFSTEFSNLSLTNDVYSNGFFQAGDQLIDAFDRGEQVFDANFGLFSRINEKGFLGISFPNLIVARISDIETSAPEPSYFKYMVVQGGYEFEPVTDRFYLEPSLLVRYLQDSPFGIDFNLKSRFKLGGGTADDIVKSWDRYLVAGVAYRTGTGGIAGLLLGLEMGQLNFYYSLDLSFQQFQQYSAGSQELTVSFNLGKVGMKKEPKIGN
jgi:type IX secretion system PorP/SprF family membrane protein